MSRFAHRLQQSVTSELPTLPDGDPNTVKIGTNSYSLIGTNVDRGISELVRYTRTAQQTVTPTNQYGVEVAVSLSTNQVISVNDRVSTGSTSGTTIAAGTYVLSGHGVGNGYAGQWLLDNATVGSVVQLLNVTIEITGFSASSTSSTTIDLSWSYNGASLSNYTLRRNNIVIASPAANATSYSDSGLSASTTYTYTLTGNLTAGGTSNTASANATTTGVGGAGWVSGISNAGYIKNIADSFSTWRGEVCTSNRFWLSGTEQDNAGWWINEQTAGWNGILDYAIGAPPADGVSWQSAASGGYDAKWRAQMQSIHANWGSLRGVYLAPAHELNGTWYQWSVNDSTTATYFRQAWQRFYGIVQTELVAKGRNAKVTINYAAGRGMVEEIWPGNAYVDIVGFDIYDHWLPTANGMNCLTESDWNSVKYAMTADGSPRGPYSIQQFAQSKGKPFAMPEWGLSDSTSWSTDPVPDNAFWIEKMHDFFAEFAPADKYNPGAGKVAFENIFTSQGSDAYHLSIWPATSQNPNASAKYQSLNWGE